MFVASPDSEEGIHWHDADSDPVPDGRTVANKLETLPILVSRRLTTDHKPKNKSKRRNN